MPLKIIITVTYFFLLNTYPAQANNPLSKLASDLMSNNSDILANETDVEKARLDVKLHSAAMNWAMSYNYLYNDSKLENSFFYTSSPSETNSHSLGLSTSFYHGGRFSLSNDISTTEGVNSFTSVNSTTHSFSQTAAYTLDLGANFLGRQSRLEKEILEETELLTERLSSQVRDEQLLNLALGYTHARLAMAMETLDFEALERSKKREALIRKRVRDGLKLKVDLYQAEMSTRAQVEAVASSKVLKESSYEIIGKLVHRPVNTDDINSFNFENFQMQVPDATDLKLNNTLEIIKKRLNVIESTEQNANNLKLPTIELSTAYVSNDYDASSSEALKKGSIGSKNNAFQVGVNLTWSIGSKTASLMTTKYLREKRLLEKQKLNIENNITLSESMLKIRIETLNTNLKSAKVRKILARKALKEYNKLYNRGRADLDSVIRAEEKLINTEKTFVAYLAERDKACYQLSYLYGGIKRYILEE
ncbi:MAG: TolC family protein [Bacteriovoracaceae bacterium]|jgi:outer membrane protein|nr:TolC family protein [Bacteriovoracaceae bacterium]